MVLYLQLLMVQLIRFLVLQYSNSLSSPTSNNTENKPTWPGATPKKVKRPSKNMKNAHFTRQNVFQHCQWSSGADIVREQLSSCHRFLRSRSRAAGLWSSNNILSSPLPLTYFPLRAHSRPAHIRTSEEEPSLMLKLQRSRRNAKQTIYILEAFETKLSHIRQLNVRLSVSESKGVPLCSPWPLKPNTLNVLRLATFCCSPCACKSALNAFSSTNQTHLRFPAAPHKPLPKTRGKKKKDFRHPYSASVIRAPSPSEGVLSLSAPGGK